MDTSSEHDEASRSHRADCLRDDIMRMCKQKRKESEASGANHTQEANVSLSVTIESVYDPLCPWTYIGHMRMRRALASASHIDPTIVYVPYIFDDETPMPPLSWKDYVKLKYPDRVDRIMGQKLIQTMNAAAEEGIKFEDYVNRPMSEVTTALRLLRHCQEIGQGQAYVEALMISHFEYNLDISNKDVIRDCAMDCGVDAKTVEACFIDDSTLSWVWDEHSRARQIHQVKSCPHYFIKENSSGVSITISGAEGVEGWISAFDRLTKAKRGTRVLSWPL